MARDASPILFSVKMVRLWHETKEINKFYDFVKFLLLFFCVLIFLS